MARRHIEDRSKTQPLPGGKAVAKTPSKLVVFALIVILCIVGWLGLRYNISTRQNSQATDALASRRLDLADQLFQSAEAWNRNSVVTLVGRARVARLQLDRERARQLLQDARIQYPGDERVVREELLLKIQSGRARELHQQFDRLLMEQEDDTAAVWEAYMMGFEVANDQQAVEEIAKQWLAEQPDCAIASLKNAELAYFNDQLETAESLYAVALGYDPDILDAHLGAARVASLLEKNHAVLVHCRQALRLDPENIEARLRLAKCLLVLHRDDDAVIEFERLIKDDPENFSARFDLVSHCIKNERPQRAIDLLEPIIVEFRDDVAINYLMAIAYQQLGDSAKAEPFLQRHLDARTELDQLTELELKTKPSQQDFAFCKRLGLIYLKYEWDSADHWLNQALTMNPNDPEVLDAIGNLERKRGDQETAVRFHQRAELIRDQSQVRFQSGNRG